MTCNGWANGLCLVVMSRPTADMADKQPIVVQISGGISNGGKLNSFVKSTRAQVAYNQSITAVKHIWKDD